MKVKLKVLSGPSTGKSVAIAGPKFVIGRAEDCHLRAKSDSISRHHCIIIIEPTRVQIRDLRSRNGTRVNGRPIEGEHVLCDGDHLSVGPLEFQVVLSGLGEQSETQPATSTTSSASSSGTSAGASAEGTSRRSAEEGDIISQWLDEADQAERAQRLADPDTRVFKFDDTERLAIEKAAAKEAGKKKTPGKLPPKKADSTKDTQEAAAKMLRRLFNRP